MIVRYLLPGAVWYLFIWLLFLTPVDEPYMTVLGDIPARSLVNGLLFVGFSHLLLSGFHRQLKYPILKKKAFVLVPLLALGTIIAGELVCWIESGSQALLLWNLLFEFVGTGLGILSFRVLYNKCY